MRWSWLGVLAGVGLGCGDDSTHPCDAGTPTCASSLVILFTDARTEFHLTVTDLYGMNIDIFCPTEQTAPVTFGSYEAQCGAGRLTITTNLTLGEDVTVKVEETAPVEYFVDYNKGTDFCFNECNIGTLQLL
jgi:hypothetical protein